MRHLYTIELWIPGEPRPKHRPQVAMIYAKGGRRVAVQKDHPENKPNQAYIVDCWRDFLISNNEKLRLLPFPLKGEDGFCFKTRVYSLFKSPKKKKPYFVKLQKPDVDNLAKLVYDALEGHVWANDSTIFSGMDTKIFFGDVEGTLCVIEVWVWK